MEARQRAALVAIVIAVTLSACDRAPVAAPTTQVTAEPSFKLELKPLTPLLPGRATHVTVDPLGNIYWVQESDLNDDTLFVIGEEEVPRATQLSAASISAALGAPTGRGHIHGIAAGPGGDIYFYFYGSAAHQPLAAFGRFIAKSASIQILADNSALAKATGMGVSLSLARGTVLTDSHTIWLWLRHTDASTIFKIDPRKLPTAGQSLLAKAFDAVKLNDHPIELTRDEYEMSVGPDQTLYVVDPVDGRLLKITAEGTATVIRSLAGLPAALSTPAVDRKGQILLFAAASNDMILPADLQDAHTAKPPVLAYPGMLIYGENDHLITIGRDDVNAYPGFPVYGMRLRDLIPHPGQEGWISYDAGSGELLRFNIKEKIWN